MTDTIFALSSGAPPAAIGVIRVSGPGAGMALSALAGTVPPPRQASLRTLCGADGEVLDRALVLWLPGPGTATGEDTVELHCHGGRAVVAAIETALAGLPGMRRAGPGEFTRRAFANGRLDLAETEGLADLLSAETELQRRNASSLASGVLSRTVAKWRERLLHLSASIEAELDFGDDDDELADVTADASGRVAAIAELAAEIGAWLARPRAELLRDGIRVVLAGPPNAGKSSLFNALVDADAAIVTPIAGTTRDVLSRSVELSGIPFVFVDTAGLHDGSDDPVEVIGIARAGTAIAQGDIVLWLGSEGGGPTGAWEIEPRIDDPVDLPKRNPRHRVSALTAVGLPCLIKDLMDTARVLLPKPGEVGINARQRRHIGDAFQAIDACGSGSDLLLIGEHLRVARVSIDRLLGRTRSEEMLDALFGRFCIGK